MMTSILDKSLDEIIKDDKKAKKREMQLKKKRQQQPQGTKKTNQQQKQTGGLKTRGNTARHQGNAKGAAAARRQRQQGQQGQQTQNQRNRNPIGNQQIRGKPRVLANRLKNRQALNNAGKQMVNRIKKAQVNRPNQNRQNQQARRKDARQNINDRRRGIQDSSQTQVVGRRNPNRIGNQNRQNFNQTQPRQVQNQRQRQNQPAGPQQRKRTRQNAGSINELRVSIANNAGQQQAKKAQTRTKVNINRAIFAIGKTSTTLNDRFSGRQVSF